MKNKGRTPLFFQSSTEVLQYLYRGIVVCGQNNFFPIFFKAVLN